MKKIRLGIVGLGNMGSGHFYNVFGGKCPSVEITAVCDINPEKLEKAKEADLFVYVVFDVLKSNNDGKAEVSSVLNNEQISAIGRNAKALAKYDIDGIMLNTYTVESEGTAYSDYMKYGSGMGFENYLRSNVEAAVTAAYKAVKKENPGKHTVIDADLLEYISSAGLRVILKAQKQMNVQGSMKLIGVNETIMEVFDITGFADILTIE